MNGFKKIMGLVMVLSIALALTISAGAASITVNAPANISLGNVKFSAYKIFDLDVKNGDEYVYTINASFEAFVFNDGTTTYTKNTLREYLSSMGSGTIPTDIAMLLTEQLKDYIDANSIPAAKTVTGAEEATSVVITELATGYYIVIPDDQITAMPILSLLSVDEENETVTLKADVPTIIKKVNTQSDGQGVWQDHADYNIGDIVPFRFESKVPAMTGYDRYFFTVHDDMSDGLTFNGASSVSVTVGGVPFTNFNVVTTEITDGCTFHVELDPEDFVELSTGSVIYIYYTATLDEDAVIAGLGNPNTVYLEYSNDPYKTGNGDTDKGSTGETPEDTVIVYTFEFEVIKVNSANERLDDARFVLYRGTGDDIEYAIIDDNNKVAGWTGEISTQGVSITVNGAFTITGLDAGTYYLEETKAPVGYNMLEDPFVIVVTPDYNVSNDPPTLIAVAVTYDEDDDDPDLAIPAGDSDDTNLIVEVLVENNAGTIFPETGGIGTTIFTVVGIVLMVGAAVVLIAKKKMSAKN